jgi:hypothetical protein
MFAYKFVRLAFFVACVILSPVATLLLADEPASKPAPTREQLEKQFAEKLSGAVLVGHYTLGEITDDAKLSTERYTISKVSKLKDDYWLFQTRIEYGDHDVNLPLPLKVLWAGDTPVITLDQVPVPGLGTFNARVLISGNEYAGTWNGKDHGGHLFGNIERVEKAGSRDE